MFDHTYEELLKLDFGSKTGKHFAGLKILRFEEILAKLSCHTIMNIHMKDIGKAWDEAHVKKVLRLIDAYDARAHVYFMSSCGPLQDQLARLAPDIPRCMGYAPGKDIVDEAIKHKCQMVQLFKPYFDKSSVDRAHGSSPTQPASIDFPVHPVGRSGVSPLLLGQRASRPLFSYTSLMFRQGPRRQRIHVPTQIKTT